jgi:hypothetical protein
LILAWAREVKAGGTAAAVPGGAVPAWGAESESAAVSGSLRLLVSFRKMISVHLSAHNLHFDTKNTPDAVAGYAEFVVKRRKELNAEAGSPPARPPGHPNNLLRLQISDAGYDLWQSAIQAFFLEVAAGYQHDSAPDEVGLTPAIMATVANIEALADQYSLPW